MLGLVIACSHSTSTSPIKVSPCIDGPIALGKLKAFAFGKEEGYETNRTKYLMLRGINVKLNVKYKTANYERKRHSIWKAYLTEGITLKSELPMDDDQTQALRHQETDYMLLSNWH